MFEILKLELRKGLFRTNIAILTIFILLSVVIQQMAIKKLNSKISKKEKFIQVEKRKVERYFIYMQYGMYGFRIFFLPSPLASIFDNSTTISNLQAKIDSGHELDFNSPEFGSNIFERPTGGNLDLSWYILLFGSILILAWGFYSFRNTGYIKFLMNFASPKVVYTGIIFARILLIMLSMLLIGVVICIQFYSNGFHLNRDQIANVFIFLLIGTIALTFVLVIGSILGAIKNKTIGGIISILFLLIVVILWTEILNLTFCKKALKNMKSIYEHEIEKIDILIKFEEMASRYSKEKGYKTREEKFRADKEMSEHYWKNEYTKIEQLDSQMIEEISGNAKRFHFWSIINPITFYRSVNNELSSRGYNGYIEFYRENKKKKKGFTRFYLDKKFQPNSGKVEPYLKDEEYVFKASSSLPQYFEAGVVLNLGYIVIALMFSYFCFRKTVFPLPEKSGSYEDISIDFKRGEHFTYVTNIENEDFVNQLYNVLSGKQAKGFTGTITIDDQPISSGENVIYLPYPHKIPGEIRAYALLSLAVGLIGVPKSKIKSLKEDFNKRGIKNSLLKDLSNQKRADVMLSLVQLKESKTYLLDEFFSGIPMSLKVGLLDRIGKLKGEGTLIVEIISRGMPHKHFDHYSSVYFDGLRYSEDRFGD